MIMLSKGHYLQPGRCLLIGSSAARSRNHGAVKWVLPFAKQSFKALYMLNAHRREREG